MTLWIVGRTLDWQISSWEFAGVFSTEDKAVSACRDATYFIGEATLDEELPHETITTHWPGGRYPKTGS